MRTEPLLPSVTVILRTPTSGHSHVQMDTVMPGRGPIGALRVVGVGAGVEQSDLSHSPYRQ